MKALAILLIGCASQAALAQTRPTLAAAVGAGVDLEPARGDVSATLGSYEFEGEILWRQWGLLARGVGTDGSIEFKTVGFDRLELVAAGTWRPLATYVRGDGYGQIVARRISLEAGLAYQRIIAALDEANTLGVHVGAHADLPLMVRETGTVPFLRVIAQRTFIIAGDTVTNTAFGAMAIDPGTPALQVLFAFGVAW